MRSMLTRLRQRAAHGDRGDTLIELLIAIVIIALTVTALLGALVTALTGSSTQQSLSTVDSVLNSFAQSAQYEAQQSFQNCTPTPYRLISPPMPAAGPVGAPVTVFVTGFADNQGLTVTVGGVTVTSFLSTTTTDNNGDAAVSFNVPGTVASGAQNVVVSDGTSTTSPTPFVVGGTTKGKTPTGFTLSVGPVQQWDAQGSTWVATTSGSCPSSGAQQITAYAQGPNGASGTLSFVVLHDAQTTVLVTASWVQNPPIPGATAPILGATLTFTAKVIPPNSTTPPPTGTVAWTFAQSPGPPRCSGSNPSNLTTIPGTNTAQTTCQVQNAGVGTFNANAAYGQPNTGANYGPGAGKTSINVIASDSTTVLTSNSSPSPAQPGSTLSFIATVGASPANPNDPKPTGSVQWTITAPSGTAPQCSGQGGDNQQMTGTGNGTNTTTCSFTLPNNAPPGTYSATAVYQGNTSYNPSSSAAANIDVSTQTPTLTFSTSPSSPLAGSSFTVTVKVNGNGSVTPTGTISWTVTAPSGPNPTCAQSALNNGQATCKVNNAVAGTYTVAATYTPAPGSTAYGSASGQTRPVVTVPPAGADIQTMGNPADHKPDSGDQIVYTYNQAMSLDSIMNGWNGSSTPVQAQFSRSSGATSLTIQCTGRRCSDPNLGTVSLGDTGSSHYMSGGIFGSTNTITVSATMTASTDASGRTVITITLTPPSGNFSAVNTNTTLTWTPDPGATNLGGVAVSTTPAPEIGAPKPNF